MLWKRTCYLCSISLYSSWASSPRTKLPQGFGKLQSTSPDELHSWPPPLWSSQISILAQSPEFGELIIALSFRGKSSQAGVLPLLARCIHTLVQITYITDLSWTMRTIRLALVRNLLTKPGFTRRGRWESNVFHKLLLHAEPQSPAGSGCSSQPSRALPAHPLELWGNDEGTHLSKVQQPTDRVRAGPRYKLLSLWIGRELQLTPRSFWRTQEQIQRHRVCSRMQVSAWPPVATGGIGHETFLFTQNTWKPSLVDC